MRRARVCASVSNERRSGNVTVNRCRPEESSSMHSVNRLRTWATSGATGGNAVAEKLVDFAYNAAGRWDTITRYADLAGTDLVATGTYGYDLAGRLTSLSYTKGQTALVSYGWTYDAASRLTQYVNSIDGTADYTNDATGQLTEADYDYQTDESYTYDAEGNRTAKFVDADTDGVLDAGDTDITTYTWDYRNRLTEVNHFASFTAYSGQSSDKVVDYTYNFANRLVKEMVNADGALGSAAIHQTVFAYNGSQIALQFEKTGTGDLAAADLSHRYLWGPAVDQLLADEHVDSLQTAGDVVWPLTDNLNTVRDLATYDSNTDIPMLTGVSLDMVELLRHAPARISLLLPTLLNGSAWRCDTRLF